MWMVCVHNNNSAIQYLLFLSMIDYLSMGRCLFNESTKFWMAAIFVVSINIQCGDCCCCNAYSSSYCITGYGQFDHFGESWNGCDAFQNGDFVLQYSDHTWFISTTSGSQYHEICEEQILDHCINACPTHHPTKK
eukprot:257475_1